MTAFKRLKQKWRWLWMSRAERAQQRAMGKLLSNLLANAPLDTITARQSCSWAMTPEQARNSLDAVHSYVHAAKAGKERNG